MLSQEFVNCKLVHGVEKQSTSNLVDWVKLIKNAPWSAPGSNYYSTYLMIHGLLTDKLSSPRQTFFLDKSESISLPYNST